VPGLLIQALMAHLDSVFEGPNGDYAAVQEALAGVPAAQALWKPAPSQNSIWQIVDHLTASKQWQIDMLEHGQAASPVWTEPCGDEAAWQAAVDRLKDAHQRLKAVSEKSTLVELILSCASAHEAHHGGQIDYLKGLQAQ
jgi:hypothetical protein